MHTKQFSIFGSPFRVDYAKYPSHHTIVQLRHHLHHTTHPLPTVTRKIYPPRPPNMWINVSKLTEKQKKIIIRHKHKPLENKNSLLSPAINSSNTFNLKVSNYDYKLPKNRKKPTGPILFIYLFIFRQSSQT